MSLLNRGTDQVTVYPETVVTDSDSNQITNPTLYQAKCILNCGFVTFRSRSAPLVTCGFILGS